MHNKLADSDFVVLTIASDSNWKTVAKKFPNGTPLTILLDKPVKGNLGTIAKKYGLTAVPETFVIDKDGQIRYHFINKRDWDSGVAATCLRALKDS